MLKAEFLKAHGGSEAFSTRIWKESGHDMQNMSRVGDWGQCCKSTGQEQLGQLPLFIMAACGAEHGFWLATGKHDFRFWTLAKRCLIGGVKSRPPLFLFEDVWGKPQTEADEVELACCFQHASKRDEALVPKYTAALKYAPLKYAALV